MRSECETIKEILVGEMGEAEKERRDKDLKKQRRTKVIQIVNFILLLIAVVLAVASFLEPSTSPWPSLIWWYGVGMFCLGMITLIVSRAGIFQLFKRENPTLLNPGHAAEAWVGIAIFCAIVAAVTGGIPKLEVFSTIKDNQDNMLELFKEIGEEIREIGNGMKELLKRTLPPQK